MASAFKLAGKRVLDIGCAEGLHSLYMAGLASEVVGIDHRPSVIGQAIAARDALGFRNAQFLVGDLRDHTFFENLGSFDLVVAWGLLHRIPNPFEFFRIVRGLAKCISLEWRSPIVPFGHRLSIAYHSIDPRLDEMNMTSSPYEPAEKVESRTGFWDMTPGAVRNIAAREGFANMAIIGYGEKLTGGHRTFLRKWSRVARRRILGRASHEQLPTDRVHAILSTSETDAICLSTPIINPGRLPAWDDAVRESRGAGV